MRTANEIAVASAVLMLAGRAAAAGGSDTGAEADETPPTPVERSTRPIWRPQAQPTLASTGALHRQQSSNGSSRL